MKKNIREFDNIEQLENVICNRARLLIGNRHKQINVTPLRKMMERRSARELVTYKEGKLLVNDDFIAEIAREIRDETQFWAGDYTTLR